MEQPCPVGFYLWDPYPWRSLCQSGSSLLSPSFLLSFSCPFFLYLFVRQSVCLSASCQCHLSGFSTIRTVCFLNLQPPLLSKGKRKFIRPGPWCVSYIRATLQCRSYVRNMQLTKHRCFSLWATEDNLERMKGKRRNVCHGDKKWRRHILMCRNVKIF